MLFTLNNGKSVNVTGYDEYVKDFEKVANPEIKGKAESKLLEEIEREFSHEYKIDEGFQFPVPSSLVYKEYVFWFFHIEPLEDGICELIYDGSF